MPRAIWMDAWEFDCCGDEFAVGDIVEWTVEPDAVLRTGSLNGSASRSRISNATTVVAAGRTAGQALYSRSRRSHNGSLWEQGGSEFRLEDRRAAVRFDETASGLRHSGYAIHLSQVQQLWHSDDLTRAEPLRSGTYGLPDAAP